MIGTIIVIVVAVAIIGVVAGAVANSRRGRDEPEDGTSSDA